MKGGSDRVSGIMYRFADWVDRCGIIDMGWLGFRFIWSDFQESGMRLLERLDRVYCNGDWYIKFNLAVVYYFYYMLFGHMFIMIDTGGV